MDRIFAQIFFIFFFLNILRISLTYYCSEFLARMLELKQKFMEAKKQTEAGKPASPPTSIPVSKSDSF